MNVTAQAVQLAAGTKALEALKANAQLTARTRRRGVMGFRLRKSIGLASLLRVNLSKTGVSVSVGKRGATFNQPVINGRKRGSRVTVGLPGSGLSYQFGTSEGWKSPAWITSIWGWIVLALVVVFLFQWIIKVF